jgi:hypothetical protein
VGCGLSGTHQVELLEDHVAQVVDVESQVPSVQARRALPADAREGDVVVDGKVSERLTARAREEVRQARARAFSYSQPSSAAPLTTQRQR